jgi:hypothetical protein
MRREFWAKLAHTFRRTAVPLAAYYAVTLGLPLANGAGQSGGLFVKHAFVVLLVPPILIVVALAGSAFMHALARSNVWRPGRDAA